MFIDIISYQLAEGVTEEHLHSAAEDIIKVWMKQQPGFIRWEINKNTDGDGYQDFVYWKNKDCADEATKNMGQIPTDHPWLACYDMSTVSSKKLIQIDSFTN